VLSRPHGGRLIQRMLQGPDREHLLAEVQRLPRMDISAEVASEVWNLGIGAFSPLEGFMGPEDFRATLYEKRLTNDVPWTIPIVLDVSAEQASHLGKDVGLWYSGRPLALLADSAPYRYDRHAYAKQVFGTEGLEHPGVGQYYAPYAAQEIFDDFPDLGITPLFFTAFFYCRRCGSVANEKTCPHTAEERLDFSGTLLRRLLTERQAPDGLIRPEVAEIILRTEHPFVE
jgi:ATP sulfurylase